jgi:hypothetical protein
MRQKLSAPVAVMSEPHAEWPLLGDYRGRAHHSQCWSRWKFSFDACVKAAVDSLPPLIVFGSQVPAVEPAEQSFDVLALVALQLRSKMNASIPGMVVTVAIRRCKR